MHKKQHHILAHILLRILLALFSLPLITLIATTNVSAATTNSASPQQYLALGDSLAFGFQPNGDFQHGYAVDLFQKLQAKQHFDKSVDLGGPGETSSSFIHGICPFPEPPPSQLADALAYLKLNAKTTGLITLQIGANDILSAINPATCATNVDVFNTHLATLDDNLTQIILPQLHKAIKEHHTRLALIEYYNPFQPFCPNTTSFIHELNNHLEEDAEGYAQAIDIFNAIDQTDALVCQLTWICSTPPDIHPNSQGYQVIAERIYDEIFDDD